MTHEDDATQVEAAVGRRALFRGGAALAGAAGITVIGASLLAEPAGAATNDPLHVGDDNDADAQTSLTYAATSTISANDSRQPATLALINETGPSLYLNPVDDWNGNLEPGQILNTARGPLVGIVTGQQNVTAELLTDQDVWWPLVFPTPIRLVDTRIEDGRRYITSPSPLTSDGKLPANTEMTIAIAASEAGFGIPALQLNVTVVRPSSHGYAAVYPGPNRPDTSTVNFGKDRTVANAAFAGTSIGTYAVQAGPPDGLELIVFKVYTTAAAWIVVDMSGAYATGYHGGVSSAATAAKRPSPVTLAKKAIGKLR